MKYIVVLSLLVGSVQCAELTTFDIVRQLAADVGQDYTRENFDAPRLCEHLNYLTDMAHGYSTENGNFILKLEMSEGSEPICNTRKMLIGYAKEHFKPAERANKLQDIFVRYMCCRRNSSYAQEVEEPTEIRIDEFTIMRKRYVARYPIYSIFVHASIKDIARAFPIITDDHAKDIGRRVSLILTRPVIKQDPIRAKKSKLEEDFGFEEMTPEDFV